MISKGIAGKGSQDIIFPSIWVNYISNCFLMTFSKDNFLQIQKVVPKWSLQIWVKQINDVACYFRRIVALSIKILLFCLRLNEFFKIYWHALLKIFWSKLGAIMTHCTARECNFLQLGTLFNCWHPTDNCAHVMSYTETVQVETHTEKKNKLILERS